MKGFFGTQAGFNSDLSLILSIGFLVMGLVAFFQARHRKFKPHATLMAWAVLLNWIPIVAVMIPVFLSIAQGHLRLTTGPLATMPIVHGILGLITQLVMTYTVIRLKWAKRWPPRRTRVLMRVALILWVVTTIGGFVLYFAAFIL